MSKATKAGKTAAQKTAGKEEFVLKECESCPRWKEVRKRLRISKLLTQAIKTMEARFTQQDFKPTVGDYLKLVEMEEEMEQISLAGKEVQATWVDPKTSCSEK